MNFIFEIDNEKYIITAGDRDEAYRKAITYLSQTMPMVYAVEKFASNASLTEVTVIDVKPLTDIPVEDDVIEAMSHDSSPDSLPEGNNVIEFNWCSIKRS